MAARTTPDRRPGHTHCHQRATSGRFVAEGGGRAWNVRVLPRSRAGRSTRSASATSAPSPMPTSSVATRSTPTSPPSPATSPAAGCWSPGPAARSAASCAARSPGSRRPSWSCSTATSPPCTRCSWRSTAEALLDDARPRRRRHPRRRRGCTQVFAEHRPEIVFHAAALKHLPLLERHPCEGVKTNVWGTHNLVELAARARRRAVRQHLDRQGGRPDVSVLGATEAARRAPSLQAVARQRRRAYLGAVRQRARQPRARCCTPAQPRSRRGGPVTVTASRRHPLLHDRRGGRRAGASRPAPIGRGRRDARARHGRARAHRRRGPPARRSGDPPVEVRFTGLRLGEKLHEVLFGRTGRPSPPCPAWSTGSPAAGSSRAWSRLAPDLRRPTRPSSVLAITVDPSPQSRPRDLTPPSNGDLCAPREGEGHKSTAAQGILVFTSHCSRGTDLAPTVAVVLLGTSPPADRSFLTTERAGFVAPAGGHSRRPLPLEDVVGVAPDR